MKFSMPMRDADWGDRCKRRLLSCGFVAALLTLLCLSHVDAAVCQKKGIGLAPIPGRTTANILRELNAHWYYDWTPARARDDVGMSFVPMINGKPFRRAADIAQLANSGTFPLLLGFNEPDLPEQGNLSVQQAIQLWPELATHAMRIGSPAASYYGPNWLRTFMSDAQSEHLRVDFITVHYYGPPDPKRLLDEIEQLHATYDRPIWITEFAVWNTNWRANPSAYTQSDVLAFMNAVFPELEKRDYVERYAWFGMGINASSAISASRFFSDDGSLTAVGKYYAALESTQPGQLCGIPR